MCERGRHASLEPPEVQSVDTPFGRIDFIGPPPVFLSPEPMKPLTPRQRAIIRAYFASGCRTTRAAVALGISVTRVREVKAFPAAKVYLSELEADCAHAVVQARAAQILAPTL